MQLDYAPVAQFRPKQILICLIQVPQHRPKRLAQLEAIYKAQPRPLYLYPKLPSNPPFIA